EIRRAGPAGPFTHPQRTRRLRHGAAWLSRAAHRTHVDRCEPSWRAGADGRSENRRRAGMAGVEFHLRSQTSRRALSAGQTAGGVRAKTHWVGFGVYASNSVALQGVSRSSVSVTLQGVKRLNSRNMG